MMETVYRVKSRDLLGIIRIPSQQIDAFGHRSLNNVLLEDGTIMMARDDDLEVVNDWTEGPEE